MDGQAFDRISRRLAARVSRRSSLGLVALLFPTAPAVEAGRKNANPGRVKRKPRKPGKRTCQSTPFVELAHKQKCCEGLVKLEGACVCAETRSQCGRRCVSLSTDRTNCGGCGVVCAPGEVCKRGNCECPAGNTCNGKCVDLDSDPAHCGKCGTACASHFSCVEGECGCPGADSFVCGGKCTDVNSDASNCGSCGIKCPSGWLCDSGECQPLCDAAWCDGTSTCCGKTCRDLASDARHCGSCGNQCDSYFGCCDGGCVRFDTNANCGACGRKCEWPVGCSGYSESYGAPEGCAYWTKDPVHVPLSGLDPDSTVGRIVPSPNGRIFVYDSYGGTQSAFDRIGAGYRLAYAQKTVSYNGSSAQIGPFVGCDGNGLFYGGASYITTPMILRDTGSAIVAIAPIADYFPSGEPPKAVSSQAGLVVAFDDQRPNFMGGFQVAWTGGDSFTVTPVPGLDDCLNSTDPIFAPDGALACLETTGSESSLWGIYEYDSISGNFARTGQFSTSCNLKQTWGQSTFGGNTSGTAACGVRRNGTGDWISFSFWDENNFASRKSAVTNGQLLVSANSRLLAPVWIREAAAGSSRRSADSPTQDASNRSADKRSAEKRSRRR